MSSRPDKPREHRFSAASITLLYAGFAALWIIASGYLLNINVSNPLMQSHIEMAKGLVFVVVTGGMLYFLLKTWGESVSYSSDVQDKSIKPPSIRQLVAIVHRDGTGHATYRCGDL